MTTPPLIPKPAYYQALPGSFSLSQGLTLRLDPQTQAHNGMLHELAEVVALRLGGRETTAALADAPREAGVCILRLDKDNPSPTGESYTLRIDPHRIEIEASDHAGVFYAIQSLIQLLSAHAEDGRLPCCRIEDRARFPWRGFMLDSARHFQPVSWIKRHLDRMAALKLNRLHWHLSDDQGWRAEIRRYPRLTDVAAWRGEGEDRYGGFYTQDEMREVVEYAAARHITVIPEIDMPGHCNAALIAYPELSCAGTPLPIAHGGWDAYTAKAGRRAFCAGRTEVYRFLEGVLTEIAEVFDAPLVHLGGDETPHKPWSICPHCRAHMKAINVDDVVGLRADFLRRMIRYSREQLGRRTITWTDGVDERIPSDQVIHTWHAHEAAAAARLGHDVINSHHEWVYLDYPAFDRDRPSRPDWMIVLPLEKAYHFSPLPDGLEASLHQHILGSEAAMWTEYAPDEDELEKQIMPRLVAFSEALWSPASSRSFDEFKQRLQTHQKLGTFALREEALVAHLD